jgi:hypothetical protein
MSLLEASREEVLAELTAIQDERRERALFEEHSVEERAEEWKELVERTGRIILASPGRHTPFDGKYNAESESSGIIVDQDDGVSLVLSFAISHEQSNCVATEYDDAGARYIQAFSRHSLADDPSVATSREHVTLGSYDYVMGHVYGCVRRKEEIVEFTAALGLAERTIVNEIDSESSRS